MASTSRRRRVSSAVPSSEEAQQAAATHAGGKKAPTAAAATARQAHDDTHNHHVPRLLLPFPRIPWHRPKPQQPAATAAAAWTRLPSSPEYYHPDHAHCHHHRTLLPRSEAPAYLTGNPFVLHGFRRCASLWEAVDGLWYMHNAFWDSWTSIASFVHSHILLYLAHTKYGAFAHDRLSAVAFLLFYAHVAWVHAPASVACHLIGNAGLSEHVHALSLELDYVCIFLASLLLGFCMAVFVYPMWATLLNFAIAASLTLYLATHLRQVVLCHHGRFQMLLGIGSLYQIPLWFQAAKDLTAGYRAGHLDLLPTLPLSLLCALGLSGSLAFGGAQYTFHLPERLAPGRFDNFTSHAFMHLWINLAFFSEFSFLVHMFQRHKGEI